MTVKVTAFPARYLFTILLVGKNNPFTFFAGFITSNLRTGVKVLRHFFFFYKVFNDFEGIVVYQSSVRKF